MKRNETPFKEFQKLSLYTNKLTQTLFQYQNQIETYLPLIEKNYSQRGILHDSFGIVLNEYNQLKYHETFFDQLEEILLRNEIIQSIEISIEKLLKRIQKSLKTVKSETKDIQKEIEIKMNSTIVEMRKIEESIQTKENNISIHFTDCLDEQYEKYQLNENCSNNENNDDIQNDQIIQMKEIKEIEKITQKQIHQLIFDSNQHSWKRKQNEFFSIIKEKQFLLILIETEIQNERKQFGCYIENQIDIINKFIEDENAFLFVVSNDKNQFETFPIQSKKFAIKVNNEKDEDLFCIGNGDIVIKKEEKKTKCSCKQTSFDYHEKKNVLIGNEKQFEVKQFMIYSMQPLKSNDLNSNNINNSIKTNQMKQKKKERMKRIQIEEWTQTTFDKIIFDSRIFNWNINDSVFDKIIFGKEKLVFLIEDEENNTFGCYIENTIDTIVKLNEKNKWDGKSIVDEHALLFSFHSYQIDGNKYHIKREAKDHAFTLFSKEEECLFIIGKCDVVIKKEKYKNECFCEQNAFDNQTQLIGKCGEDKPFTIKSIRVYQMKESEEQRNVKKTKYQQIEDERIELKRHKYDDERIKLKQFSQSIYNETKKEIKQIEEWTKLRYQTILFDSNTCDWEISTSTFDKHIFNREKCAILLETNDGIKYGVYIHNKIDCYKQLHERKGVIDPQLFIFSFKDDKPMKYSLNQTNEKESKQPIFFLFEDWDERLFVVGDCDIWIGKQKYKAFCQQTSQSLFKYHTYQNALIGKCGTEENQLVDINRIIVIQLRNSHSSHSSHHQPNRYYSFDMKDHSNDKHLSPLLRISQLAETTVIEDQYSSPSYTINITHSTSNPLSPKSKPNSSTASSENSSPNVSPRSENISNEMSPTTGKKKRKARSINFGSPLSQSEFQVPPDRHQSNAPSPTLSKTNHMQHVLTVPVELNKTLTPIIKQIEQWTKLKYQTILFDSEKHDWSKGTSVFDSMIVLKEKIVILIEIENEIIFGGFMKRKITRSLSRIGDENCFLFSNKNNQMKKYEIKKEKKWEAFEVYPKTDKYLFIFGNDVFVYKKDVKEQSHIQERNAFFQYGIAKNVLIGKVGEFEIRHLYVVQMM